MVMIEFSDSLGLRNDFDESKDAGFPSFCPVLLNFKIQCSLSLYINNSKGRTSQPVLVWHLNPHSTSSRQVTRR